MSFEALDPPAQAISPTIENITDGVGRWLESPDLIELVEEFGGPRPMHGRLDLPELKAWSAANWDFRSGRERNLIDSEVIAGRREDLTLMAATNLGMVRPKKPTRHHYDFVLMLGGLVRACVLRPEYASSLLQHGITAGGVFALSGFRSLNAAERELLPAFDLAGMTEEHEVMERILYRSFGIERMQDSVPMDADLPANLRVRVACGEGAEGLPVGLVVAPSRDPHRRANTPDSYAYWAEKVANVRPGQRVLMVTSSIYVPFQHTDAVRTLAMPYGCTVETVGIDTADIDERGEPQVFRGVNYLQEINSMIRSLAALAGDLDARRH